MAATSRGVVVKKKKQKIKKVRKSIVFFGGSGFVGSYFVKRLLQNNHKVIIYDLVKPEFKDKNLKFIKGDILDKKKISKTIKKDHIIFNFAGWADLESAPNNLADVKKLNIEGNTNILEICEKKKLKDLFMLVHYMFLVNMEEFIKKLKKPTIINAFLDCIIAVFSSFGLDACLFAFCAIYRPLVYFCL